MSRRGVLGALGGVLLFAGGMAVAAGPGARSSIHRQLADLLFRQGDLDGARLELQAATRGGGDEGKATRPRSAGPRVPAPNHDALAPVHLPDEDELAPVRFRR